MPEPCPWANQFYGRWDSLGTSSPHLE
ncbi:hypothetical protein PSAB6_450176 [Paraburkholderia sabiae]|nr:hypothetical protein PSAB6_450176 [Paraburkholderia sabiae]